MERHTWTEADDLAALYFYKYGERPDATIAGVALSRGMSEDSLRMRIANFKAIDAGSGLDNWARQSEDVFRRYSALSQADLYSLAFGEG